MTADILPTICGVTGTALPGGRVLDGRNIACQRFGNPECTGSAAHHGNRRAIHRVAGRVLALVDRGLQVIRFDNLRRSD